MYVTFCHCRLCKTLLSNRGGNKDVYVYICKDYLAKIAHE